MGDEYIQRVSLNNMGANNFGVGLETEIDLVLDSGFQMVDLSFKTCKNDYGCVVSSYNEWH